MAKATTGSSAFLLPRARAALAAVGLLALACGGHDAKRGASLGEPAAGVASAAASAAPPPSAEPAPPEGLAERARRLLREAPLVDSHNDLPWVIRTDKAAPGDVEGYEINQRRDHGDTDLPRLREGGVGTQFWSVYVPGEPDEGRPYAVKQLEQIDIARRLVAAHADAFAFAGGVEAVEAAHKEGKIASLIGIES